MFEFDLQMFADDAEDQITDTVADDTVSDEPVVDAPEESAEVPEEGKEPIPEELDGLPEEAAREVMAEAAKLEQKDAPVEETAQEPDDSQIVKNQQIPYPRFKQKVDESNALKAELEAYKKQFGELRQGNVPQQNYQQPAMMKPVAPQSPPRMQPPRLNFTPEVIKQIDELKKQEALRMSGLTQEDLDGMEYMEENDPRKAQYQFALKMAETTVMNRIQQAQMEQMRRAEELSRARDASVMDYNDFAQREMSDPEFPNIMQYAQQDFFFTKSPAEQRTLAEAYSRIECNTASPVDVMLIKNYFTEAKAAYRGNKPTKSKKTTKVNEAKSFPRSQQVQGASDNDASVSVATLEKMLQEKPWDEIDPKWQKVLMGE